MQSTREISKRIADYLELADPAGYPASERAKTVRAVNDILQGRGERGMDSLLAELEQKCGESYADEIAGVRRDMEAFMDQKAAMFHAYTLTGKKWYKYKLYDRGSEPPLKIVNQRIFDWAANGGFPPDFFEGAYFDHVTIYCLPDSTHCVDCIFDGCTFAACRMVSTEFADTSLYSCEFHSCYLSWFIVADSTMAHTHFYDCTQRRGGFIRTNLKSCSALDCIMDRVRFNDSTLDGCSFDRVKACGIRDLHTCEITQSGATDEECRRNRETIYKALSPAGPSRSRYRQPPEHGR